MAKSSNRARVVYFKYTKTCLLFRTGQPKRHVMSPVNLKNRAINPATQRNAPCIGIHRCSVSSLHVAVFIIIEYQYLKRYSFFLPTIACHKNYSVYDKKHEKEGSKWSRILERTRKETLFIHK